MKISLMYQPSVLQSQFGLPIKSMATTSAVHLRNVRSIWKDLLVGGIEPQPAHKASFTCFAYSKQWKQLKKVSVRYCRVDDTRHRTTFAGKLAGRCKTSTAESWSYLTPPDAPRADNSGLRAYFHRLERMLELTVQVILRLAPGNLVARTLGRDLVSDSPVEQVKGPVQSRYLLVPAMKVPRVPMV